MTLLMCQMGVEVTTHIYYIYNHIVIDSVYVNVYMCA